MHAIWQAETKAEAEKAFDLSAATYEAKYPKAVECLAKDRGVLLTFYDFPAERLAAYPDDDPDRERVLDGASAARQDEGEREPDGVPDDGFQVDGIGLEGVAGPERLEAAARGHPGGGLHRDGVKQEKPAA